MSWDSFFKELLHPEDADAFFREHWDRSATVIRGSKDKFRSLYSIERDRWIEHALELEAATRDATGAQQQVRIATRDIADCLHAGMTICANVSRDPTLWPHLSRFASELQMAGSPFAKLYASPNDGGFAIHFDSFHVFVCQLTGSKRWRFSRAPAVRAPLTSGKLSSEGEPSWPHGGRIKNDDGQCISAPADHDFDEATLEPGDCLYLPPGTWHFGRAIGRSVALSISPPRTTVAELLLKVLEGHLGGAAWREDLFSRDRTKAVPDNIATALRARLSDLARAVDAIDVRSAERVWRINSSQHGATDLPASAADPLQITDRLCHINGSVRRYLIAPQYPHGPDAIYFYAAGKESSFPLEALPFIQRLSEAANFAYADALAFDPSLPEQVVRNWLEQFLSAGLLTKSDPSSLHGG